jgi:hypothetical protein
MWWRVAAASAALVLAASVVWAVSAGAAPGCTVLQVRNTGASSTSALYRVVLPAADGVRLGELDYRMNALGYAGSQGLVYGMAERNRSGPFPDGAHVVTLERNGQARDLGPVRAGRAPWHPLRAPTGGAVKGNRWYVVAGSYLYTVDIEPTSRSYLSVLSRTAIQSWHRPFSLDDFDVDPVDGELYGVSMTYSGVSAIVRIDRGSGRVAKLADAPGLPPSDYGSVVIGPDRALYVTANEAGGLYRVARDGSVARLAGVPPMSSSDAAGCLPQAPPPQPPTTTAPPTSVPPTTSTPPPSTSAPPTESPMPSTTPSRAPTSTTPPPQTSTPPSPMPPPEPGAYVPLTPERDADGSGHDTKEKRRWALATLLLLIGASAAVRRTSR